MIDFVITWLDDSDPNWIDERNRAVHEWASAEGAVDPVRFRDWGLLKYWFRSVERHAPWVNQIHLVTPTRVPEWLRVDHPKLNIVDANELNPFIDRPTFSSHAVEANLHRIPGLADQFVYFNDDMFIVSDITPEFFFRKGLPKLVSSPYPLSDGDSHSHALLNTAAAVNSRHSKRELYGSGGWKKLLSFRNGLDITRIIPSLIEPRILPVKDPHLPTPMLKSTSKRVAYEYLAEFQSASITPFRSHSSVAPIALVSFGAIVSQHFWPVSSRSRGVLISTGCIMDERPLIPTRARMCCVNDSSEQIDFARVRDIVVSQFAERYPKQSAFERDLDQQDVTIGTE